MEQCDKVIFLFLEVVSPPKIFFLNKELITFASLYIPSTYYSSNTFLEPCYLDG